MRFIADNEIPVRYPQFFLNGIVTSQFIQPGDGKADLLKGIAGHGGFDAVVGENFKTQMKFVVQFVLPLFRQAAGADDETTPEIATGHEFLDEQPGHDGLARTGIIGQYITQGDAAQHFLIDGGNLVRQRLYIRRVDGEIGIKQMCVMDTPCFGSKAQLCAVGIKTPGKMGFLQC